MSGLRGIALITAERQRQIEKGYTPEHDQEHTVVVLLAAARAYLQDSRMLMPWPVDARAWDRMSTDERLAKAGALIAAALDQRGSG